MDIQGRLWATRSSKTELRTYFASTLLGMLHSAHPAERKFMSLYANFRRPRSQIRDSALSNYASGRGQSPSSSKHGLLPTKLANRVLHPKRGNVDENIVHQFTDERYVVFHRDVCYIRQGEQGEITDTHLLA